MPNLLIKGFITTIRLSVWGTLLAVIIGLFMGILRTSLSLFNRALSRIYVESVRNLPPLVLIFIFYYFISSQIMPLLGVDTFIRTCPESARQFFSYLFVKPAMFTEFISAIITLGLFEGAYITEIVRSGIQSIEHGQWEASRALGMTRRQQMRFIIIPQALQKSLPMLAGQFVSTIKDSAIVSVISIQELSFQGTELMAATYMTFEIWITITVLYLILTLPCSMAISRIEERIRRRTG